MPVTRRVIVSSLPALAIPVHGTARAQSATLSVYNAQHVSLTKEWAEAFTAETGIKLSVRNGGDTELGNQIVQEGANSPADVFLTENSPAMALVQSAKLFAPIDPATLALVEPFAQPAGGQWVGIAARETVLIYDTRKLNEAQLPKSVMDLADPAWKSRWAASPSGADFQAIVSAILQLEGVARTEAWLKAMKANYVAYRGNSTIVRAVNAGEVPSGLVYHYYYTGDAAHTGENTGNTKLHYFRNKDAGAFLSLSGGGVLASSKNKEAAQRFIAWIAGPKGQAVLRDGTSYEYAVGKGQASNARLVPIAQLDAPPINPATLDSRRTTQLMTEAGIL